MATLPPWLTFLSPVFTDHKNLIFFHSLQGLNCHQARWLLDLADFDLHLIHIPGSHLAGPDALSWRPDLLPPLDHDNYNVTLLPPSLFVCIIDSALSSHIASSSSSDPLALQALQFLDGSILPAFRSHLSDWQHTNSLLTFKGHIYVPSNMDLHCSILLCCHDHPTTSHPGYLKMHQLVANKFWWPGLASFVCAYVAGCSLCQQNKANTHPSTPPLAPIPSSSSLPFCQLSCNLITDLPVSAGFDSLLVMVDHSLSKGVILCPTKKNVTTEGIAYLFFHKVFLCFSLYTKIISDRGPQFASKFAKELSRILQYDLSLSTAYHPQTDGETEHVNQEIKTYLRIFCGNQPSTWADSVTHAKFAHNHRPHSVAGKSPFFLMMGYEPIAFPTILPSSSVPAVEICFKELTAMRNEALAAHELACQVMAAWTRKPFIPFKKGDKVWLEAPNLKWHVVDPKFAPKWEGSFTIVKVLSSITYELKLLKTWKIHLVFHTFLLSRYGKNPVHSLNFPKPPPDLIAGEEEYEIERILCHQGSPSNHFFLIQWKRFFAKDDSWEPKRNLKHSKTTLTEYKKRHSAVFHP